MEKNEGSNQSVFKKWWFWVIVVFIGMGCIGAIGDTLNTTEVPTSVEKVVYTIEGEKTGEYGREVVLNADTDMPVTKYLYKLPAGKYVVTTTYEKAMSFYIVKDKTTIEEGNTDYPETLDYVSEQYLLTNGDDNFNGHASKSVEIELGEDESVCVVGTETLLFEKQ